ncbi:MAG TPA: cytochrome P450 [Caulobacteraceae bacterium]|nr:cytochrome P450 [Caulobacteraceae bacterium]
MADGAMALAHEARLAQARAKAAATPLDAFQVEEIEHFTSDTLWPWFERLRAEDPVHYTADSEYGPYWSVTRYADIVACESDVARLSSSQKYGGITLFEPPEAEDPAQREAQRDETRANFIALDPPRHDAQRKVVAPRFSTPALQELEPLIRSRAAAILDELPIGEEFDFVDKVAIELTSQMLATLFDFPFEQRRILPRFSDMLLSGPADTVEENQRRQAEMFMTLNMFIPLWTERTGNQAGRDLISLLANDPATDGGGQPEKYMSNIILLIVAGSDTTRHSITGALLALNQHPAEYEKLRGNPALLESAVPEFIRWQSPVAYMRRTALEDLEIGGKGIRKGEKVAMWYVSGNRDETAIERANEFIIDRARPRQHAAFGFGIHRCLGQRLAEMQLRVVWEEMLKRFPVIEVTGEPRRLRSNFVKGYEYLPVRIAR